MFEKFDSSDYTVYFVPNVEPPENWNIDVDGIFRPDPVIIESKEQLLEYLKLEQENEGRVAYEYRKNYFKYNAHLGEEVVCKNNLRYFWQYNSVDTNFVYTVKEMGDKIDFTRKNKSTEDIVSIAFWKRNEEGLFKDSYKFTLMECFFMEIPEADLIICWRAIKDVWKYIAKTHYNEV